MEVRFADDDWSTSFDELKEKEQGLRERLLEAYRTMNMLKGSGGPVDLDKASAMEHARKAIKDYRDALEEVEKLIMRRKSGTV